MKELRSKSHNFCRTAGFVFGLLLFISTAGRSQEASAQTPAQATSSVPNLNSTAVQSKKTDEDWTTLALNRAKLPLKRPILADSGEFKQGGFIRERFVANWRAGDPFDLYVIRPIGAKKPPVILYLYSFPDDTDPVKTDHWCETATSGGYAAVAFVSSLTGHRLRFRQPKESLVAEMQEALAESTHDVQLILDYLNTRDDLDTSRIGMFGAGSGASIAILASAADPRILAVDLLAPWGDWKEWFATSKIIDENLRPDFLKPEYLAAVTPLDPVTWFPKMHAKTVRLQDIRKNKSMPDDCQKKLEAAAPDFALINEYGNGRSFLANQPPAFTFQWLKDQLKPDATTVVAKDKSERVHFYPAIEDKTPPASSTSPATSAPDEKGKDPSKTMK
jgi:hypothetical protein